MDIESQDAPFDICVTETKPNKAWLLQVRTEKSTWSDAALYSITAKQAFSKNDSRFLLEPLAAGLAFQQIAGLESLVALQDSPPSVPAVEEKWRLLTKICAEDKVSRRFTIIIL